MRHASRSPLFKMALILGLTLALIIPASLAQCLCEELSLKDGSARITVTGAQEPALLYDDSHRCVAPGQLVEEECPPLAVLKDKSLTLIPGDYLLVTSEKTEHISIGEGEEASFDLAATIDAQVTGAAASTLADPTGAGLLVLSGLALIVLMVQATKLYRLRSDERLVQRYLRKKRGKKR